LLLAGKSRFEQGADFEVGEGHRQRFIIVG